MCPDPTQKPLLQPTEHIYYPCPMNNFYHALPKYQFTHNHSSFCLLNERLYYEDPKGLKKCPWCQVWTPERNPQGTHHGYHYYKCTQVNSIRAKHPTHKNVFRALILKNLSQNSVIHFKGSLHIVKWCWRSGLPFSNQTSFSLHIS